MHNDPTDQGAGATDGVDPVESAIYFSAAPKAHAQLSKAVYSDLPPPPGFAELPPSGASDPRSPTHTLSSLFPSPVCSDLPTPPLAGLEPSHGRWRTSAWPRRFFASLTVVALLALSFAAGQLWTQDGSPETLTSASEGAVEDPANAVDPSGVVSLDSPTLASTTALITHANTCPSSLRNTSEAVADVAERVSPSVVVIFSDDGQGSGVVWDAENGYIVTNNHVVETSTTVEVEFPDGQRVVGTVIGGDPSRDLAVVGVDTGQVKSLCQAVFARTTELRVGQLAVAIGGPFGLDQSVTAGVVSAINRVLLEGGSDPSTPSPVAMIQTDAPINPGNSGGALADRNGEVIGINTQIRTAGFSAGNVGVGFAIPSDTVLLIADRIVGGESLVPGFLGIQGISPTDGDEGALVTSVVAGSPADISGLLAGDLIVAVNGEEVTSMLELAAEIKLYNPGDTVEIVVRRDGVRLTFQATLATA